MNAGPPSRRFPPFLGDWRDMRSAPRDETPVFLASATPGREYFVAYFKTDRWFVRGYRGFFASGVIGDFAVGVPESFVAAWTPILPGVTATRGCE